MGRIWAVILRHLFLYRRSFGPLLEIFYWPLMDLLLWGFVSVYLQKSSGVPAFVSYFIGALILWDILFRAEQGISVSFLQDMWSRNLVNVFVAPIRISEYLTGLLIIAFIKVIAAFSVMSLLAWVFYSFDILKLGMSLLPLALNLVAMGCTIGIFTTALILRYGLEAEILAWAIVFLFMPFSAVFYPVSVLPPEVQAVANLIPSSHAFEGMRTVINKGIFPANEIFQATLLNLLYFTASLVFFRRIFKKVLLRGIIPKIGE